MEITRELIDNIVKKIVDNVHPKMIILFGSYARGNPSEDSDIDLIVIKDSDLKPGKRAQEIDILFSDRTFPLDIIVYTPEEVKRFKDVNGSFIKDIFESGEIVYDYAA